MESEEAISPILSDKSVLDCTICSLPLTIPVFQCENGHIICSSCLEELERLKKKPKCPTCSCTNPGSIRNRAMEQVLESVTDLCAYTSMGCSAGELIYSAKRLHEQTCAYAPYPCPSCGFHGSPASLYRHLDRGHRTLSVRFRHATRLTIRKRIKFLHFLDDEDNGKFVYILQVRTMKMYCVQDPRCIFDAPPFPYILAAKTTSHTFEFRPATLTCHCANDATWKAPVTDADRSDEAIILDRIFKGHHSFNFLLVGGG